MDPNFIKLFRLSQLIIEYLLVRTLPFLSLSFIALPLSSVSLSLSLCLSPPFFSLTQHSQQYLSEQGHALEQWLQQSQQVMETMFPSLLLVVTTVFKCCMSSHSGGGAPTPDGTSVFTKHNRDMGMKYLGVNGWSIYDLMSGAFMT